METKARNDSTLVLPYQHGQIPALGLRPDKKLATCTYKDQIAPCFAQIRQGVLDVQLEGVCTAH